MSEGLTPRELEVLRLAAMGMTNRAIAARLSLSLKSIEHMLGSSDPLRAIYPKIGVSRRAEAVAWYTTQYGGDHGLTTDSRVRDQLVEVLAGCADQAYAMRLAGQPLLALELAGFVAKQAGDAANHAASTPFQAAFHTITARALVEQGTAVLETSPSGAAVAQGTPIATALRHLAKKSHNLAIAGLGVVLLAGANNIDKQYQAGWELGRRVLSFPLSPDLQLRAMRTATIAALYTGNAEGVAWCEATVQQVIEDGRFTSQEQLCETQEGVGRALGLMGMPRSAAWLEAAESTLAAIGHLPLRHLRLIQSQLEVACRTEPEASVHIERLGQEGLELAEQHGYVRHRDLILETLEEALN